MKPDANETTTVSDAEDTAKGQSAVEVQTVADSTSVKAATAQEQNGPQLAHTGSAATGASLAGAGALIGVGAGTILYTRRRTQGG